MNKYFVVYRVPLATMDEWMQTPPERMKEQMDTMMADMNAWTQRHKASFADEGTPLGKTKTVTKGGIADSRNDLNFCITVEAESHEAAAQIFADCPHLEIPTSSIDVMEIPHVEL